MALYNKKKKIQKHCLVCNNNFYVLPSRRHKKFCSKSCSTKYKHLTGVIKSPAGWNRGKKMNKEWKKKLSEAKLKNPVRYWLGKTRYDLIKKDKSEWREYRKQLAGRKEYIKWRTTVFIRDNYTCLLCKQRGGSLEAHHIETAKNKPELILEVKNGVTLCKKCHNKTKGNEQRYIKKFKIHTISTDIN